ncbi:hypothetical protein OS493_000824 [Desmophyllum pertusum]|uniref:RNA-dependent RNA polymerase n=1 Tax=Desmophyllum pertusum TaxID=174260 RepID=A0A9X0D791_9CNID|nr:hypothetical protein OS493_000824 [Desmophyllum pertusum]
MSDFATSREAMSDMNTLGIVGYSQPYSLGYLDTQTVMLLAEAGVSREYLETLQNNYYEVLERLEDKTYAGYFLRTTGNDELLQEFQRDGITDDIARKLQSLKSKEIENMKLEKIANENDENDNKGQGVEKFQNELKPTETLTGQEEVNSNTNDVHFNQASDIRILTPDARVVYGASDPYDQLNYGECFFQPTLHEAEHNSFSFAELVLVMRRPSYHVGDVRVLKLTHGKEAYKDLYDCIVFPTRGARPHANECAGVGWVVTASSSSNIARKGKEVAMNLKCMEKKPVSDLEERKKQQQARQALMDHFGHFKDYENLRSCATEVFMKYASLHGTSCSECELLKKMFLREFDWSEHYDHIDKKLKELEEAHDKEMKNSPNTLTHRSSLRLPVMQVGWIVF